MSHSRGHLLLLGALRLDEVVLDLALLGGRCPSAVAVLLDPVVLWEKEEEQIEISIRYWFRLFSIVFSNFKLIFLN
jgi:hypothetical protein